MSNKPASPEYLLVGTLVQPDTINWCLKCNTPSIWWGPVWILTSDGVTYYGNVIGCCECKIWITTKLPFEKGFKDVWT